MHYFFRLFRIGAIFTLINPDSLVLQMAALIPAEAKFVCTKLVKLMMEGKIVEKKNVRIMLVPESKNYQTITGENSVDLAVYINQTGCMLIMHPNLPVLPRTAIVIPPTAATGSSAS